MAESHGEFAQLIERVRAGSEDAARELIARYGGAVIRVIRSRLDRKLRAKYDSADLAQDVWASFFNGALSRYPLRTPTDLAHLLTRMAGHKAVDAFRAWHHTRRRREHLMDSATVRQEVRDVCAGQKSPSQAVAVEEEWEQVLQQQSARDQRILILLRQGHSYQEIADELGVAERTVRRVVMRLAHGARP
jgi:RNA polymerase sigma-70 factor (ECF subfamily)